MSGWSTIGGWRYQRQVFHDDNGKIIGEIKPDRGQYSAQIGYESLGVYVDAESARKAVERAVEGKS